MKKVLAVAEKPSIAKSVAQILGNGRATSVANGCNKYCRNFEFTYTLDGEPCRVVMTSVMGHLMGVDFGPAHRTWTSCDPRELFEAPVIKSVSADMRDVARNLEQEARDASLLVVWTDCDREGENIGAEIASVCQRANLRLAVKRARFSVVQAREVHAAMAALTTVDARQADAVDARTELDLRIGAAFTRFQTMRLGSSAAALAKKLLSYGSCQFPTLGFVVEQYLKARAFVSERQWALRVNYKCGDDAASFSWGRGVVFFEPFARALLEQCRRAGRATVTHVDARPVSKWRPLPLTTVELQKSGARLLRMPSDRMMSIAEKLYNQGLISYPRTETDQFDAKFDLERLVQQQTADAAWGAFATRLLDPSANAFSRPRAGRHNDQAHPPIHPTRGAAAGLLQGDERRVYEFVVRRFLACCSKDAQGRETTMRIELGGEAFSASGLVVLERNYLDVYPYDRWGSTAALPALNVGDTFVPASVECVEGSTTAPRLLTEADLITLMDKNGIGTDATIQDHIKRVIEREYVVRQAPAAGRGGRGRGRGRGGARSGQDGGPAGGGQAVFVPSTLGIALYEGYEAIGFDESLCRPQLRAHLEAQLKQICSGNRTGRQVVRDGVQLYASLFERVLASQGHLRQVLSRYLSSGAASVV